MQERISWRSWADNKANEDRVTQSALVDADQ